MSALLPLLLLPLLGAAALALPVCADARARMRMAVLFAVLPLFWTIGLMLGCGGGAGLLFQTRLPWIPALGAEFHLGLDGIGILFVLLTGIVTPFALAIAPRSFGASPAFPALVLVLQSTLYGAFTAFNFVLWFLFWELALIPAYLLIRLWGGAGSGAAALRFFLMTLAGSLAMLAGFLALFLAAGTFDFPALARLGRDGVLAALVEARFGGAGGGVYYWIFLGILAGLAVKVPLFPLHTWLPAAYAEAPAPVSILLTGLLSKMGIYGFLRILLPIFPAEIQAALDWLLWLAVATIVLSALAAMVQTDLKRMLAYSSINHLGYCLLALFAVCSVPGIEAAASRGAALGGVLLQVFNHGIIASCLFAFVGLLEARAGGLRGLGDFGGLRARIPVFAGLMAVALFASLGLPGLSGFVGEFLIFKGVFGLAPLAAAVSIFGLLFTAVFLLRIQRRVFHGRLAPRWQQMPDLAPGERLALLPMLVLIVVPGIWPAVFLDWVQFDLVRLVVHLTP